MTYTVVERSTAGTTRHESYRSRRDAEARAAERANDLSDNSPTEIFVSSRPYRFSR
jgi:hypothetical protein